MKKLVVTIAITAICSFSNCKYSDLYDSMPCTEVSVAKYPAFYNGNLLKIGELSCFTDFGSNKEVGEDVRHGIPVTRMVRVNPCKMVDDITVEHKLKTTYGFNGTESRYIPEYTVHYSGETSFFINSDWGEWYEIRKTPDIVYENGLIEIFRRNGTLRYRGRIIKENGDISTVGDCYNKSGSASTRHTNNADTCK